MSVRVLLIVVAALALIMLSIVVLGDRADSDSEPDHRPTAADDRVDTAPQASEPEAEQYAPAPETTNAPTAAPGSKDAELTTPSDDEPDWLAVDDVDALWAELHARFEAGDAAAARHIARLAQLCFQTHRAADQIQAHRDQEHDPERWQLLQDRHEVLQSLKEPCADSRYARPLPALEQATQWNWRAADAGDEDAMYTVVFGQSGNPPPEWEAQDRDALALERRQDYARQLRTQCHAPSLHSMGTHIARNSPVTDGLEMGRFEDVDDATARQMEGFAHRYAAAHLEDDARPAHTARRADHALTAAEEQQAARLAEEILANCE